MRSVAWAGASFSAAGFVCVAAGMFLFRVSDCGLSFASYGFDQCDAAGFDQFLAAHGASAFARFGFDSDLVWVQAEDAGDAVADGVVVIGQLRALGMNHAVDVYNVVSSLV